MSFALALLLLLAPAAETTTEPLALDPAALAARPQIEMRVTEKGQPTVYKGVPLHVLLAGRLDGPSEMANLRALADSVILLRADDGYQVAVPAVEAAMDPEGAKFFLALERDGQPLPPGVGPIKLIVPGDPKPVRWIRQVTSAELIRLPRPTPQPPAPGASPPRR